MKKNMLLIILTGLLACQALCPRPVSAQESGPSRADKLVLHDSMLVLWSMGLKESAGKTQDELCRDALFFVILSEGATACGLNRDENPEFFRNIPVNYQSFVSKEKVEETAQTVFNQKIRQHAAPEGTFFDGNGYFLDYTALSGKTGYLCHLMPDDLRPGHVYRPIAEPVNDTGWTVYAKLLRILKDADEGLVLMKSASFAGEIYYQDGALRIKSFIIAEDGN